MGERQRSDDENTTQLWWLLRWVTQHMVPVAVAVTRHGMGKIGEIFRNFELFDLGNGSSGNNNESQIQSSSAVAAAPLDQRQNLDESHGHEG